MSKYTLPKDFYKKVLELERQVDSLKLQCPENTFKELSDLYRDAIEYFGFIDD
jgi:hypothetical protein